MAGPRETVYKDPVGDPDEGRSWWSSYREVLAEELTPTALAVVEADARYIVDRGVFAAGEPGDEAGAGGEAWPESRSRSGLVIGAVQSGKTASMFGVIAQALDRGVDMVVVLSGTRLALWGQTFDRFVRQVDVVGDEAARRQRRILVPSSPEALSKDAAPSLARLYSVQRAAVREALIDRRPIVCFALKHPAHLNALAKTLKEDVFPAVVAEGEPFHLLVIDDEADDGSILDALAEAAEDPLYGQHKQTPRAIARLWEGSGGSGSTAIPQLFATYVAYTATAQANLKQAEENPLAPRDFVAALRTPGPNGSVTPRSTTFAEPLSLPKYYTGGSVFYVAGRDAGFCQETSGDASTDLDLALKAYLVAGAVRLARRQDGIGPATARTQMFETKRALVARAGKPHTMLIHPSGLVQEQFDAAADVLIWAGLESASAANLVTGDEDIYLPASVAGRVADEEESWKEVYESYASTGAALQGAFDLPAARSLPPWDEVKQALVSEVIPGTRLSVVNSDERADNRPQFEPSESEVGWCAPHDLATIFVAGNVMSRGLTLDGLTTTLFLRQSQQPFADTQMQMQRWFGYRGGDIELCRVFLPDDQLNLFRKYHEGDEAQRLQVVNAMNESEAAGAKGAPKPMVLHGTDFLATGKIGGLLQKGLYPGPKPMTKFTNGVGNADPNIAWLAKKFAAPNTPLEVEGLLRGIYLDDALDLMGTANLLDELRYPGYHPDPTSSLAEHWRAIEQMLGLVDGDDLYPLYRAPLSSDGESGSTPRDACPYSTAAYLRLWSAALNRKLFGFHPTDKPSSSWAQVDLEERIGRQPRFRVGIRFGSMPEAKGALDGLGVLPMYRSLGEDGSWDGQWASRNPNSSFYGDELMDYHVTGVQPPYRVAGGTREFRPFGEDGQILFHVLQSAKDGPTTLAVGVCIPEGGPDQIPALMLDAPAKEQE